MISNDRDSEFELDRASNWKPHQYVLVPVSLHSDMRLVLDVDMSMGLRFGTREAFNSEPTDSVASPVDSLWSEATLVSNQPVNFAQPDEDSRPRYLPMVDLQDSLPVTRGTEESAKDNSICSDEPNVSFAHLPKSRQSEERVREQFKEAVKERASKICRPPSAAPRSQSTTWFQRPQRSHNSSATAQKFKQMVWRRAAGTQ
jgi:hypothetical protein